MAEIGAPSRPRALVTGGAAGLGKAFVELLLARGYDVVSVDRASPERSNALSIECDLADRVELDRNIGVIVAGGPYQVVILNAGVSATGKFGAMPLDAYRRLTAVNVEAPLVLASSLVRAGAVSGHICFVSSLSHFTGYPGAAVYAASKDALAVYARSVRRPFAKRGVTVTVAFPGPMRTAHAARHAPVSSSEKLRTDPAHAAHRILKATLAGRSVAFSDARSRLIATAGGLLPGVMTRATRRMIFEKLETEVW